MATICPFPKQPTTDNDPMLEAFDLTRAADRAGALVRFDLAVFEEVLQQLDAAMSAVPEEERETVIALMGEDVARGILLLRAAAEIDRHKLPDVRQLLATAG